MDSKSKIKAREATTRDAAGIHRLARELAETVGDTPPMEEAVTARLEELLDEPRARVFVAETEAGIVGGVSFWIKPDLAHGDTVVEVPMLVVAEDYRRAGVGKVLMEEVRNVASDNGASQIELVATRANVTAREFYRSLGFVEADVVSLEFVGSQEDPPEE
ncbi:MAG TPA: GNAT family N-acetyltransferase [Rubrobacter sp.]|nr:GNAT family N-acetyltransferase [Rubrobacter sp.]